MKYISDYEYYAVGYDEFKIMVTFPDRDAIYLKCTKEEIGNINVIKDFLYANNVQYDECRISCYKMEEEKDEE